MLLIYCTVGWQRLSITKEIRACRRFKLSGNRVIMPDIQIHIGQLCHAIIFYNDRQSVQNKVNKYYKDSENTSVSYHVSYFIIKILYLKCVAFHCSMFLKFLVDVTDYLNY